MKRLIDENINTPEEYSRIFEIRKEKQIDWFDAKRWEKLLGWYKGGRIVDLGCLDSLVPFMAKARYPKSEVWGLDYVPEVISFYQRQSPKINWAQGDVYQTNFPSNYFDYAVLGEVIEHLEEPQKAIDEARRILKRNGILAISTPKEEEIEPGAIDGDRHLWSFNKDDISALLNSFSTFKIKVLGSQRFPVYKYAFPVWVAYAKK